MSNYCEKHDNETGPGEPCKYCIGEEGYKNVEAWREARSVTSALLDVEEIDSISVYEKPDGGYEMLIVGNHNIFVELDEDEFDDCRLNLETEETTIREEDDRFDNSDLKVDGGEE